MLQLQKFPDVTKEMLIQKYKKGVKLLQPNSIGIRNITSPSIDYIMNFPLNVFILDLENKIKKVNIEYARSFELTSAKDVFNKTIFDLTINDSGKKVIKFNNEIFSTENMRAHEADIKLYNNNTFETLTIKFPLYDKDNNIRGLLGFGSVMGRHSFKNLITYVSHLGLLSSNILDEDHSLISGMTINNIYFTKRQSEILRLLIRGKSSKEIALQVGLSYRTVQHYLENIKIKLNVSSKSQLIDAIIDYFK